MPVETLTAAAPITVPAKTFDKIWVEEIVVHAPDPNGDARATARLRHFCEVDGVREFAPAVSFVAADSVLSGAATDPDLDAALTSLMRYIAKLGIENGVIATPAEE